MSQEIIESQVFSMEPKTLDEAMAFAKLIADSDLVPEGYKGSPGNVMIAIQMGFEIGLKPLQALQNITVINGRPCVWGDALPAIAYASKQVEDFREDLDLATMTATCQIKRKGQPTPIIRTFSQADATKAGLWGKVNRDGSPSTWAKYPKRMLQMRARAFAIRDGFADYLKGLSVAEEQLDVEPVNQVEALPAPAMPKRISETKPEPEWKHVQATKEQPCGLCKESVKVGQEIVFSVKAGVRCGNCDPTLGPPAVATD